MFGWGGATRIYLAAGTTDMRQGFEGLYGMARDRLLCDPRGFTGRHGYLDDLVKEIGDVG